MELGLNWLRILSPMSHTAAAAGAADLEADSAAEARGLPIHMSQQAGPDSSPDSGPDSRLPSVSASQLDQAGPDSGPDRSSASAVDPSAAAAAAGRTAGPASGSPWRSHTLPKLRSHSFWQSDGAGSGASPSSNAHAARSSGSFFPGWLRQRRENSWLQQQLLQQGGVHGVLFRGLRVRMGVATGVVAKGREVKNSAVYKTAQGELAAAWNACQQRAFNRLQCRRLARWLDIWHACSAGLVSKVSNSSTLSRNAGFCACTAAICALPVQPALASAAPLATSVLVFTVFLICCPSSLCPPATLPQLDRRVLSSQWRPGAASILLRRQRN